jgi:3-oxoacyl-[acyl-carrier protein] reductase
MKHKGAVYVITGGQRGLGLAMAEFLSLAGATCVLLDLNQSALQQARKSLTFPQRIMTYSCDITNEQQVEETFQSIRKACGKIDALINNAGIMADEQLISVKDGVVTAKMTLQSWQKVIDVNLTGTFLCGREAAIHMLENGGVIINVSSVSRVGNFGQSNYSASKAGVAAIVVTWARELSRYGIRVMGLAPGVVDTEMVATMAEKAKQKLYSSIPVKRLGQPCEVAKAVAFILENEYINGRVLELDGGLRL